MISDLVRRVLQPGIDRLAAGMARLGITANMLTVVGALLHFVVLWLIARGQLFEGGVLLFFSAGLDGIDGTLARRSGESSRFGAFLDSSLDRIAEILVYLGLVLYAQQEPTAYPVWLVYLAITGSIMVSYTRARSEGLELGTRVGWFTRLERMTIIWIGLLSGYVLPALWLVAVGAWLTTVHRVVDVSKRALALDLEARVED